jgi:hypothetical protein
MSDDKLRGSEEIAVTKIDGDTAKEGTVRGTSGSQNAPGSLPIDGLIGEADIPMPMSIDAGDEIVTLTPSLSPEATSKGHQGRVVWVATHSDGSVITEYDEDGNDVSSETIDHQKIREFKLVDRKGRTVISQDIIPGQCFFYRRRTALQTGKDVVERMHLFGWRYPIATHIGETGEVNKEYLDHLVVLFESDMHVEVGCFEADPVDPSENISGRKSWKYPINWRDIDDIPAE